MHDNVSEARRSRRLRTLLVGVPVLAACAIGPWLLPWGPTTSTSGEQPVVAVSSEPSATPSEAPLPSRDDVRELSTTIERTANGGYDLPVDRSEVSGVATEPGPYQALGRIRIPAIGLDVGYGEGVFADTLTRGPGHWPGTPMPGRTGNAVLSGHRNTHTQPFKELDRLQPGDKVTVAVGSTKQTTFEVTGTEIIPEAEYKDQVLRQPEDERRMITLFACHPEGNPIFRIVVTAEVVDR